MTESRIATGVHVPPPPPPMCFHDFMYNDLNCLPGYAPSFLNMSEALHEAGSENCSGSEDFHDDDSENCSGSEDLRDADSSDENCSGSEDLHEADSENCSGSEDLRDADSSDENCSGSEDLHDDDDIHFIQKRGGVTKHRNTKPKKHQTPPIRSLEPNTTPKNKEGGTGRRAMAIAAKADAVAAAIAADVKATEAATQVANDWITLATLTRKTPHKGGAAGANPEKKEAADLLKKSRTRKVRD